MTQLSMRTDEQRLSATALVKFCDLHGVDEPGIASLRLCCRALETGDVSAAVTAFQQVPLGGNGCFNDWQPSDVANFDYELGTFRALVERWARLMRLLDDGPNNSFKPSPHQGGA